MLKLNSKADIFEYIDKFCAILVGLMVFFVFFNVILRAFFNSGLAFSEELARYLFVFVTYIGAISAMKANTHIAVDTVLKRVSSKIQLYCYIISRLIIALTMIILVIGSVKMVAQNTNSTTAALGISFSFLYLVGILTGSAITVIAYLQIKYILANKEEIANFVVTVQGE